MVMLNEFEDSIVLVCFKYVLIIVMYTLHRFIKS